MLYVYIYNIYVRTHRLLDPGNGTFLCQAQPRSDRGCDPTGCAADDDHFFLISWPGKRKRYV